MRGIASYRSNQKRSASKQQIVLMLFQTAVQRMTRASESEDIVGSDTWYKDLHHVRAIFIELLSALDDSVAPEFCSQMRPLYLWIIDRMTTAGRERTIEPISEALKVTTTLYEGWQGVVYGQQP